MDSLSIRNGKAGVFLFISGEFFRVKGFADSLPDKGDEQEGNHQGRKGGGNHPAGGKIRQSVIEQALTLAELEAVGRAAVLIPSPNVAENHQYYNAMELQKAGAAVVIEEKDLTGEKLVQTVSGMLAQPGKLAEMGRNARSLSVDDSLDRIADALLKLVKTP